ncbi:hypothetical protein CU102_00120 [Phyllobacterium brassicacearum]|uniref:Uncharacterized protein n=1 Tax=Phyllobacterium brassicacearum TaxID=314235 RepID=A0A2P7BVN3_9HYPH|nr:hypothetical protein [Phyllobacterium brassicacearum]PSH70510.1 hypothetical protein CU102_00120 [Phyllobacterium brassicacearum]TDQ36048.1 hypothetical protein DEV91_101534 [Phyllobacterium brassicacearum]
MRRFQRLVSFSLTYPIETARPFFSNHTLFIREEFIKKTLLAGLIGCTILEKAVMWQGDKRLMTIKAENPGKTYVQSLKVDGKAHDSTWQPIDPSAENVKLDFTLGDKPSCWGSKPTANIPPSFGPDGTDTALLTPAQLCDALSLEAKNIDVKTNRRWNRLRQLSNQT